jgi:hypothetical protein
MLTTTHPSGSAPRIPMPKIAKAAEPSAQPWWRERFMWLVVGGPAVVVVASFVTLAIAIIHADPVVSASRPPADEAAPEQSGRSGSAALEPAIKARNHAATGGHADAQR